VGATNDIPNADRKTGAASEDTRNFIEKHHVTKLARKAVQGSGEESADLLQDKETEPSPD
jgi:hypothetical protein